MCKLGPYRPVLPNQPFVGNSLPFLGVAFPPGPPLPPQVVFFLSRPGGRKAQTHLCEGLGNLMTCLMSNLLGSQESHRPVRWDGKLGDIPRASRHVHLLGQGSLARLSLEGRAEAFLLGASQALGNSSWGGQGSPCWQCQETHPAYTQSRPSSSPSPSELPQGTVLGLQVEVVNLQSLWRGEIDHHLPAPWRQCHGLR
jgi:hypothetical protein